MFSDNLRDNLVAEVVGGILLILIIFFWRRIGTFLKWAFQPKYHTFNMLRIKDSLEKLKKTLKIIVIDDDNIFPVDGFRDFGYSIENWNKLTVPRLKQLQNGEYDIIILDIYGVAQDIAEKDGFDVLVNIKNRNPCQIIIAYSGQSFDFSKNKFWELADEKLGKPTPFLGTQSIIDQLIERTFTIEYHKNKLEKILADSRSILKIEQIEDEFIKAKLSSRTPDWIAMLQPYSLKHDELIKLESILKKLFGLTVVK